MTERERLRERLIELLEWHYAVSHELTQAMLENLADYLLANGIVLLPCKVGDTVYTITNDAIVNAKCYSIIAETEDDHFAFILTCKLSPTLDPCSSYFVKKIFGKTVFLTRKEAEKALGKRKDISDE